MPKPLFGLAKKILDMHNHGTAQVPSNVVAAAGRVMNKKDNNNDRQLLYNSVAATQTNAKAYKGALRSINAPIDLAAKYAQLGNLVSQGGMTGVAGGLKMVTEVASDANKLAHAKWFKDAVGSVLGDALKGERFANSMGAFARQAGMALSTVGQAGAIYGGIVSVGEALGGLGNLDQRRLSYTQRAMDRINPRLNAREQAISKMQFAMREARAAGAGALPLIGGSIADIEDWANGRGGEGLSRLELSNALDKSMHGRGGSVDSLRSIGRERYYAKTYGTYFGRLAAGLGFHGAAAEAGTTEEGLKAKERADLLSEAGYRYTEEGDFAAARTAFAKANQEVESNRVVEDPASLLPRIISMNDARASWPFSQMPRKTRTGE